MAKHAGKIQRHFLWHDGKAWKLHILLDSGFMVLVGSIIGSNPKLNYIPDNGVLFAKEGDDVSFEYHKDMTSRFEDFINHTYNTLLD